jgi:hypothetical protein
MASTRTQQGQLVTQASMNGFLSQVLGSLVNAAIGVFTEAGTTPNHANRLAYARAIAANPQTQASNMLPGYLQSPAISAAAGTPASILDSDVDAQTSALFNTYANWYAQQIAFGPVPQIGN